MSKIFKTLIRLPLLSIEPSGNEGELFYDSSDKVLKYHNGTSWKSLYEVTGYLTENNTANVLNKTFTTDNYVGIDPFSEHVIYTGQVVVPGFSGAYRAFTLLRGYSSRNGSEPLYVGQKIKFTNSGHQWLEDGYNSTGYWIISSVSETFAPYDQSYDSTVINVENWPWPIGQGGNAIQATMTISLVPRTVELNKVQYLSDVSSNVQTQINSKLSTSDLDSSVSGLGYIKSTNAPVLIEYPINTISPTVVDTWDLSLYTTIEYTLQIVQGTNFRSSKIMILTDQNLVYYTEYGIITIGNDINGLSIDASTTTIPGGKLGKLVIQISDANTNNAQVKLLKTTIA